MTNSANTPNLSLPYIMAAQAQKHVTHNDAIRALDALVQLAVLDQHSAAPPATPANGDRYIVASGGTGAWAGHDTQIAAFQDGAWAFFPPQKGWTAWVVTDANLFAWNGTGWAVVAGVTSVNPVALVGINATADTTNRLAVKSPALLFDNIGNGVQAKFNKAHVADTASTLYQTAYSGRAEIGLTGDDNFHFKVSPDGAAWNEAIVIDRTSGAVTFPHTTITQVNADWNAVSGLAQVLNKPSIPAAYTLPAATAVTLGGVKAGSGLTVAADGTLAATGGTGGTAVSDQTGRYYLRNWQGNLAKLQQNVVATRAVIAFLGDSWTYEDVITNPVKRVLQARYGNAGPGYQTLNATGAYPPEVTVAKAGTWNEVNAIGTGPDLSSASSSDIATPAKKTLTAAGTDFVIHYYQQPGGGSFTYSVDGGTATTVNTAAASLTYATVTIPGLALGSHAIALTVTVAGTAGVTLCGIDVQTNTAGVRLHKLGAPGQQASQWAAAITQANFTASLQALNPCAVHILFGTNEMNANTTPAAFTANLGALVASIRAALPTVDIVLATPGDNGLTGTSYAMSDYATAMQAAATANNTGFINNYLNIGPYAAANANGLYLNSAHLNLGGGQVLANIALAYLTEAVLPNPVAVTGLSSRNVFVGINPADPSFAGTGAAGPGGFITTGVDNFGAGFGALATNTSGSSNMALGSLALSHNTTGNNNVGIGQGALQIATTASGNVGIGNAALQHTTTGNNNVGIGLSALLSNSTGLNNIALGVNALVTNTTGSNNMAIGPVALSSLTTGGTNVGIGINAATNATTGSSSVAIGQNALYDMTTGDSNTAVGNNAGRGLTTGRANTVIGRVPTLPAATSNSVWLGDGDGNAMLQIPSTKVTYTYGTTFILGNKVTVAGGPTTAAPTLTTGPLAGNPTKWLPYDDNGTTRYIPAW